jgi:16S rRNA (cytosine1407-C5)-methyltransferase
MKHRDEILPKNFQAHYQKILGDEESEKFFEASMQPLKKCFRVNTLQYSVEECKKDAQEKNWNLTPVPWCAESFFLEREEEDRSPLGKDITHLAGGMYIQEASSMIPVEALLYNFVGNSHGCSLQGKICMDIASAPGSKTTQLAAKMKGEGILIANELSSSRIKALHSNVQRCGVSNVILTHYEGANLCSLFPEMLDYILLDAPCTGEGTVRKNYDALKNWSPEDAVRMGTIQKSLIVSAFQALKPGGEMVYSTCTLAHEENCAVVKFLQEKFPEEVEIIPLGNLFDGAKKCETPEGFLQVWPHIFDTEGFFVAKIRKKKSLNLGKNFQKGKFPFERVSKKLLNEVENFFQNQWGCTLPKKNEFWKRGNEIWLFPQGSEEIFSRAKCDRIGIPLLEIHKKNWNTSYEAGLCFGEQFTKNIVSISEEEVRKIFSGQDIFSEEISEIFFSPLVKGELEGVKKGCNNSREILVVYKNFPIAIGKGFENGKWKNKMPRSVLWKN